MRSKKFFDTAIHITFGNVQLNDDELTSLSEKIEDVVFDNFPSRLSDDLRFVSFDFSFPEVVINTFDK